MVVAGCVGGAGQAGQVDERGAADVVGDGFEGELEGVAEEAGGGLVLRWRDWDRVLGERGMRT